MRKLKLLWRILKTTGVDKLVSGFVVFMLLGALVIQLVEPSIIRYGDSLWYTFTSFSTIGFGDIVAITLVGRIFTVLISLYGIIVIALIPGILVSYFTEITALKKDETISAFLDKLENLPSLTKDELADLSKKVKSRRYKL